MDMTSIVERLMEPGIWQFLLAVMLGGFSCSLLSPYLVVRDMTSIGVALAAAAGFVWFLVNTIISGMEISPMYSDYIMMALPAVYAVIIIWIAFLSGGNRTGKESRMMAMTLGFVAASWLLASLSGYSLAAIEPYLLHPRYAVDLNDFYLLAGTAVFVIAYVLISSKRFRAVSLDRVYAHTQAISSGRIHVELVICTSVVLMVSIYTFGLALSLASLIFPGCVARLVTFRFGWTLIVSVLFGVMSVAGGTVVSCTVIDILPGIGIILGMFGLWLIMVSLSRLFSQTQDV